MIRDTAQMNKVLNESSTFLFTAPNSFVIETPAKLKNAIDKIVKLKAPIKGAEK